MNVKTQGRLKRVTVEAVVIRADGTREPLGIIADSNHNPNFFGRASDWLRQRLS